MWIHLGSMWRQKAYQRGIWRRSPHKKVYTLVWPAQVLTSLENAFEIQSGLGCCIMCKAQIESIVSKIELKYWGIVCKFNITT